MHFSAVSRRYTDFWLLFPPLAQELGSWPARGIRREAWVKEEDGAPSRPKQMVVKVGSGSSGDIFELKGAEWADV